MPKPQLVPGRCWEILRALVEKIQFQEIPIPGCTPDVVVVVLQVNRGILFWPACRLACFSGQAAHEALQQSSESVNTKVVDGWTTVGVRFVSVGHRLCLSSLSAPAMDPHYSYEYDGQQRVVDPMTLNGGYDYDTTIECRENGVLCGVMMHGRG